jgi:transcriptional antiterminator RfaH
MINDEKDDWLVVYTKCKHEKKIAKILLEKNIEFFLPLQKIKRKWSDRIKTIEVPLFKGIIFVKNNISKNEIYSIPNVGYILQRNNKLQLVKSYEIENIKILMNELKGNYQKYDSEEYIEGGFVEVIKGPFKGLIGTSIVVNRKHQLIITITGQNESYSVQLPKSCVKKLKS